MCVCRTLVYKSQVRLREHIVVYTNADTLSFCIKKCDVIKWAKLCINARPVVAMKNLEKGQARSQYEASRGSCLGKT